MRTLCIDLESYTIEIEYSVDDLGLLETNALGDLIDNFS